MRPAALNPVVHVVGTRPNFVKAAPVIRALRERSVPQLLLHTGQHYDRELSDVFFADLGLASPDIQLTTRGSGGYGSQLGRLLVGLERELGRVDPPLVVLYGDVNSTLAAALAATHLRIPIAHVEAGLRSFDLSMPEEVNRRVVDVLSALLFATLPEALDNLAAEGVDPRLVHHVGNPMIDSLVATRQMLDAAAVQGRLGIAAPYAVATIHRGSNVDAAADAARVVAALADASRDLPVVLPLHPRGRGTLALAGLRKVRHVRVIRPLGYVEFLSLVGGSKLVITDSGGVQEETSFMGVPCLTLRPHTERPSTITLGTNRLVRHEDLGAAVRSVLDSPRPSPAAIPLWDAHAGERIAAVIVDHLSGRGAGRVGSN